MNQRGDMFGYLLPMEWGTNVIVVVADGGEGNLASKMFVVVRSDRFQASWAWPAFGGFCQRPDRFRGGRSQSSAR